MQEIKILDVIKTRNAILHDFGIKVFNVIKPILESNEEVCISFNGLKNVTSGFCNASIGKLFLEIEQAGKLIKIKGLEGHDIWQDKVSDAINLAKNPERLRILNDAISELLIS